MLRFVNRAKSEEQKYIEQMKVFEVVDGKGASGSKVIRTRWVVTETKCQARWVAQEFKWMDGPDSGQYAPTLGLELVKGVLSRAAAGRSTDHMEAVVDVRRAHNYAEPLPKTFVELLDCYDQDTQTNAAGDCGVACAGRDRLQGRGNMKKGTKSKRLGW